jgi:hypothetical protein
MVTSSKFKVQSFLTNLRRICKLGTWNLGLETWDLELESMRFVLCPQRRPPLLAPLMVFDRKL